MLRHGLILCLLAVSGLACNTWSADDQPIRSKAGQPEGDSRAAGWSLPVAPMPREPKRYWGGTSESALGVVVHCYDDVLTIRCDQGILREFQRGVWVGTKYPRRGSKYRFDQVHIGDVVFVGFDVADGLSVAQNLSIRRRPGGKIPPEPWTDGDPYPWQELMQARQDHEEKGTPLPPRLDPNNGMPGRINGIDLPREVLRKAIAEAAGRPYVPPATGPKQ